jgi:hypothetical protein
MSKEAIAGLMKVETSLTPEQCLKMGFASQIIPNIGKRAVALIYNEKNRSMKKPLMDRFALAMAAFTAAIKDEPTRVEKAMMLTTDKGVINTPYEEIQIGDAVTLEDGSVAPDGDYTDTATGDVYTVAAGVISNIVEIDAETGDAMAALKAENETLKAEIETVKAELSKTNEAAEQMLAKFEELAKMGSSYTPPAAQAQFKREPAKPVINKAAELREKRKVIKK